MSKRRLFIAPLTDEDELLYKLGFDSQQKLRDISVNYRARIRGMWYQVCRFDNAHGPPHVHRFWRANEVEQLDARMTPDLFLRLATQTLRERWQHYRKLMEEIL